MITNQILFYICSINKTIVMFNLRNFNLLFNNNPLAR
jgi:hypothetical protein